MGYAPHGSKGLTAGSAACCAPYIRCLPFLSFSLHVVQSQSVELSATTKGRVVERRLLARTQGRAADCTFTSYHHVLSQVVLVCLLMPPAPVRAKSQVPRTQVVGGAHDGLLPQHAHS